MHRLGRCLGENGLRVVVGNGHAVGHSHHRVSDVCLVQIASVHSGGWRVPAYGVLACVRVVSEINVSDRKRSVISGVFSYGRERRIACAVACVHSNVVVAFAQRHRYGNLLARHGRHSLEVLSVEPHVEHGVAESRSAVCEPRNGELYLSTEASVSVENEVETLRHSRCAVLGGILVHLQCHDLLVLVEPSDERGLGSLGIHGIQLASRLSLSRPDEQPRTSVVNHRLGVHHRQHAGGADKRRARRLAVDAVQVAQPVDEIHAPVGHSGKRKDVVLAPESRDLIHLIVLVIVYTPVHSGHSVVILERICVVVYRIVSHRGRQKRVALLIRSVHHTLQFLPVFRVYGNVARTVQHTHDAHRGDAYERVAAERSRCEVVVEGCAQRCHSHVTAYTERIYTVRHACQRGGRPVGAVYKSAVELAPLKH